MGNESLDRLRIDKGSIASVSTGWRRWLLRGVLLLVLLLAAYFVFARQAGISVETATVVQVYPTQSFTLLNASGYLVAQRKAAVASKITGRLEWLGVEEGSHVKSGQTLARLESRDLAASMDQAQSAVHTAKATADQAKAERDDAATSFKRQRELLSQGIVSRSEYDTAETRYRRAVAGVAGSEASYRSAAALLRGAEVAFDYSQIRAPFDGVVLTKNADVGDIITPLGAAANSKAAVVTMADLSSLEVEADVSESSLVQVRAGQPCEITLDALPGGRFRGVVHTIVPTADRTKASVMVKVRFVDRDSRILPEMSAKVAFLSREATKEDQKPRTAVNYAAVSGAGKDAKVFMIVDGKALAKSVVLGSRQGEMIELSGVKPGDKVVLRPLDKLRDGVTVKVKER